MQSPVGIGDAISILTSIYKIREAYESIPHKLNLAFLKFEDVKRECEALNEILATSRGGKHRSYPGTETLIKDLKKARKYFHQFEPLTTEKTKGTARVIKTFSAKWKQSEIDYHVAIANRHRENLKDFEQLVLIEAAQRNIELSMSYIESQTTDRLQNVRFAKAAPEVDSISFTSDHISILSKASYSLSVARQLESERLNHFQLSPIIEASSSSGRSMPIDASDDLRGKLAHCIQKAHLHKPDPLQVASLGDLQYIADLPEQWLRSQLPERAQSDIRTKSIHRPHSSEKASQQHKRNEPPPILPRIAWEKLDGQDVISLTQSWDDLFELIDSAHQDPASGQQLPPPALETESSSRMGKSIAESLPLPEDQHIIKGKVMIATPWITSPWIEQPLPCRLKLVRTDGSIHVQASTVRRFNRDAMPCMGWKDEFGALQTIEADTQTEDEKQITEPVPLTFTHAVMGGMRSFPKILHPIAEVADSHPYIIEFYRHQYVHVKCYSKLPKAVTGFMYFFERKKDRDFVREKLFGKDLLCSIGMSTIQFDKTSKPKPCSTQAMSLWRNNPSISFKPSSPSEDGTLTVTIQCSTKGKQTKPDCAREFIVLKANQNSIEAVRNNWDKELELELCPIFEPEDIEDELALELIGGSSINTAGSTIGCPSEYSMDSRGASSSSSSSQQPESRRSSLSVRWFRKSSSASTNSKKSVDSLKCWIKFTDGCQSDDRKHRFLDPLEREFGDT